MTLNIRWLTVGLLWLLSSRAHAEGLLAIINPAQHALPTESRELSLNVQYFSAADYTALRHFSDDWRGTYTPRDGDNLAVIFARSDITTHLDSWAVGYFYRADALLESNRDLTDIVHANKTGNPLPAGRTYNINLNMNGFEAHGIRIDKAFVGHEGNHSITWGLGTSLLKGQRTRFGQASGHALSTPTGYIYNLDANDSDSRYSYPFMPPGETQSIGYALDLGVQLTWSDGQLFSLALNDLAGKIRWRNLPVTSMTANSAVVTHDAQGYIVFNPSLSGQNIRTDSTQSLDPKGLAHLHIPFSFNQSINLDTEWIKNNVFPRFGFEYKTAHHVNMLADYDIRFKTMGLKAIWHGLFFGARSQRFNLTTSRAYGVQGGFNLNF